MTPLRNAERVEQDAPLAQPIAASDPGLSFYGFVALMASLMAINALGVDCMLSALPEMGRSLGIVSENERQLIIIVYVAGFGVAQLFWGPLGDRYGRKPVLLVGMTCFTALSIVAAFSASFPLLLAARVLQGVAAAAPRVLVSSIVRDCFSGRKMAQVMSLSFIVFLVVPVLAPSIGQLLMLGTGSWRAIFFLLAGLGLAIMISAAIQLRETLHPEYRQPLSVARLTAAFLRVVRDRAALGYSLAGAVVFSGLIVMISTIQQICADVFGIGERFTIVFGAMAVMMGFAAFTNASLVLRLGSRILSHSALLLLIVVSAAHALVSGSGHETLPAFMVLQGIFMFCFGLIGSNFNSMAMERMGDIAGTAASLQGFVISVGGATIGGYIGQHYHGTVTPIAVGNTVLGLCALAIVFWTERGRLFRPHHAVVA